jgi:hypothetical protein
MAITLCGPPFPEHRIYQQLLVTKRVGPLTVQQRSRLEQRFIRYPNQGPNGPWTYQNRFRHMVRVEIPLGNPDKARRWYVPVYDEIFLGIPPNFGARTFDHNRLAAGFGRAHGTFKAEVVYMNQFLGQRNGRIFEFNNTVMVSLCPRRLSHPFDANNGESSNCSLLLPLLPAHVDRASVSRHLNVSKAVERLAIPCPLHFHRAFPVRRATLRPGRQFPAAASAS